MHLFTQFFVRLACSVINIIHQVIAVCSRHKLNAEVQICFAAACPVIADEDCTHLLPDRRRDDGEQLRPLDLIHHAFEKGPFLIQHMKQMHGPLLHCLIFLTGDTVCKIIALDPLQHIVDVLKMIVKALTTHVCGIHDILNSNLADLFFSHQLFHAISYFSFCCITHTTSTSPILHVPHILVRR